MPERGPGRLTSVTRFVFIVVTGSLLMVLYDLILEPAAMSLDMWSWEGDRVPARNYLAWFLFSALFHSVGQAVG
ncbi:MAG: carotenoid biosynthesis protein [Marinilabiliales bacterium]|nr:carotenoid biosynthesis protein [Marinilabiliales bacterium]